MSESNRAFVHIASVNGGNGVGASNASVSGDYVVLSPDDVIVATAGVSVLLYYSGGAEKVRDDIMQAIRDATGDQGLDFIFIGG